MWCGISLGSAVLVVSPPNLLPPPVYWPLEEMEKVTNLPIPSCFSFPKTLVKVHCSFQVIFFAEVIQNCKLIFQNDIQRSTSDFKLFLCIFGIVNGVNLSKLEIYKEFQKVF